MSDPPGLVFEITALEKMPGLRKNHFVAPPPLGKAIYADNPFNRR